MASAAEVLPPASDSVDIIQLGFDQPEIVLLDPVRQKEFVDKVREASTIEDVDISTSKGREEVRKMAAKVTRAKTMLDQARKDLTADYRKKVSDINDAGKAVVTQLDELADEVRAPLTAWEEVEKAREARCNDVIVWLQNAGIVMQDDTSATIRARGKQAYEIQITKEEYGKRFDEALGIKTGVVSTLRSALEYAIKIEDERLELDRLRKEAAERDERDRQEREAREVEARRVEAARVAEEARIAAEKDAAERVKRAADQAAEEAARRVAEAKQREVDEANQRAAAAERAQREAAEKAAQEKAAKEAAERAEQEKRERSRNHRSQIHAKTQIELSKAGGITDEQALAIVRGLVAGKFSHIRIEY